MHKVKLVMLVTFASMTRLQYNEYRGWNLSEDENGDDEGYLVVKKGKPNTPDYDGYVSWVTKEQMNNDADLGTLGSFGEAIELMKDGQKVSREGWNGKGMFIYYVPANSYPASGNSLNTMTGLYKDDMVPYGAYIAMKAVDGTVVPWLASQTDMLANDWSVIDSTK